MIRIRKLLLLMTSSLLLTFSYAQNSEIYSLGENSIFIKSNAFIENKGQIINQNGDLYTDLLYIFNNGNFRALIFEKGFSIEYVTNEAKQENKLTATRIDYSFINCNTANIKCSKADSHYNNYYYTHTNPDGVLNVRSFNEIVFKEIYPHIDLIYRINTSESEDLENKINSGFSINFKIHNNADVNDIQIKISENVSPKLFNNYLTYETINGIITQSEPIIIDSNFKKVIGYKLNKHTYSFNIENINPLPPEYEIDPTFYHTMKIGTYFGGSFEEEAYSIDDDNSRNLIIIGKTNSTSSIASSGAFQTTLVYSTDVFIAKFNELLSQRIWATYYGGSGEDFGKDLVINSSSDIFITGYTKSDTVFSTSSAFQTALSSANIRDAFVAKFNSSGSRIWGSYLGGNGEDIGNAITLSGTKVIIVGSTKSSNNIATSGAHQSSLASTTWPDGFIAEISSNGSSKVWATYYGGANEEDINDVCVDGNNNIYIAGNTNSTSNIASSGSLSGYEDAFIVKFNSSSNRQRVWGYYYGGSFTDIGHSIDVSTSGNEIYLLGETKSTSGIATTGAHQTTYGTGDADAFLVKFNNNGARQWGTYYGGSGIDIGYKLKIDINNNIVITGITKSPNNIAVTNAYQTSHGGTGYEDAFLAKFKPSGVCWWTTYYGKPQEDKAFGVTSDNIGFMAMCGYTRSTSGIATSGAYDTTHSGANDAFIVKFCDILITEQPKSQVTWVGNSVTFCVTVAGTQYGTYTYQWYKNGNVISGATSRCYTIDTVQLTDAGNYSVRVMNSCSGTGANAGVLSNNAILTVCNITPTQYICYGDNVTLTAQNISGASYFWTPNYCLNTQTSNSVVATPLTTTTYTLRVISAGDTTFAKVKVVVKPLPNSNAGADITICSGATGNLGSSSTSGYTYQWSPTTGLSNATISNPTVTLTNSGSSQTTHTYTVTTTLNGCTSQDAVLVKVNPLPIININASNTSICTGSSATLTASGASTYSWSPSTGLSAVTGSTVTASPTSTITYTVTGTDQNGCVNSTTITITVNPLPTISFNPSNPTMCIGGSVSITASGAATYTWTPSSSLNTSTGSTVIASPSTTTTYTVTGTSSYGCKNTNTVTVTVNSLPNITVSASPKTICIGNSSVLTASGANSYTWTPSTGLSSTTGTTVTASPTTTTTYIVTGTSGTNCTDTAKVTITVNSLPNVTISPTNPSICYGDNTTLTSSGASTYSWSPSTGLSATTGSSVTASPATTTTYTVTGTNSNGCMNTANVTVTVNPLPTISFNPSNPSMCIGGSVSITASGAATYSWSPATSLNTSTGPTVIASPSTTTTYTVTGTSSYNCVNINTVSVTVNSLPNVNVSASSYIICSGNSSTLTASGANSYTWSPSTGLSATTGSSVTASPTSTTTYTVTGTSGTNCSDTAKVTITVYSLPNVTVTPNNPSICYGANTTLTASGALTYSWSPSSGLSSTTGSSVTASPTTTTTYTVTGTSSNGCSNTANVTVTVNQLPTISFNPSSPSICVGSSVSITASGAATYSWTPSSSLNIATGPTVIASPSSTTTYTVTGTSSYNCQNTNNITVTVNSLPNVNVSASPYTICIGNSSTLTASGANSYTWTPSTGLSSTTGTTVTASPTTTTTYTVTGTSGTNCTDTAKVTITVNSLPNVTVSPNNPSICYGASTTLTASGASTYSWSPSTGLSSTTGSSVTANPTTTTTYTVTGTNSNGCINTANVTVTVNPLPNISFNPSNPSICIGGSVSISASGAATYSWSPSNGLNTTFGANVSANPSTTTTYKIIGTSSSGCIDSINLTVTVNSLPNVSVSSSANNICSGEQINLTASGAQSYTWSPSTYLSSTTGASVTAIPITTINYIITGTNAANCSDTASIKIEVNPKPNLSYNPSNPFICIGDSINLSVSGASTYSWTPSTTLSSSTGSSVYAKPVSSTNYTIIGTDNNSCKDTVDIYVTVHQLPVLNFNPASPTICQGDTISVYVSGASTYSWSPTNSLNTGFGKVVIANPSITTTYKVVGTSVYGCINTDSIQVVVNNPPNVTASASKYEICNGETITLQSYGASQYFWSPSGSLSASTGSSVFAYPSVTTTYVILGSNAANCSDTANITIKVNQLPSLTILPNNPEICIGDSVTLTVTGANSYAWSPNYNISALSGSQVVVNPLYTITYKVTGTDNNGCKKDTTSLVTVNSLPIIDAGNDTSFCNQPFPAYLSGMPTNGVWSGVSNISPNGKFIPNKLGVFKVYYTFIDSNNCTNFDSLNISVITPQPADAGPDTNTCIYSQIFLNGNPVGGTWHGSSDLSINGRYLPTVSGTHELFYHYGIGTCFVKDSVKVIVKQLPVVDAGNDTEVCFNSPVFNLSGNSPKNGIWKGTGIMDTVSGKFNPKIAGAGSHVIYYSYKDPNTDCHNYDSIIIEVNPTPILNFSFDSIYCKGSNILFTNTSNMNDQFWYSFGDGSTASGYLVSHTYQDTGLFSVMIVAMTSAGCKDTLLREIEIIESPKASFLLDQHSGCEPLLVNFSNESEGKYLSYNWNFGNGQTSSIENPKPITYFADKYKNRLYYISLQVSNICGTASYLDTITVFPSPTSYFEAEPMSGCDPLEVTFRNRSYGLPTSIIWYFGDGSYYIQKSKSDTVIKHSFKAFENDSVYEVKLVTSNQCGQSISSKNITAKPNTVRAYFTKDKTRICLGDTLYLFDFHVGNGVIAWDFGDGNISNDSVDVKHVYTSVGNFLIKQFVDNGCAKDTFESVVTVEPIPFPDFEVDNSQECVFIPINFKNLTNSISGLIWDFGDGDSSSNSNPVHTYIDSGIYDVKLTVFGNTILQCPASISKKVTVLPNPVIDITMDPPSGCEPLTIIITNKSQNAESFIWDLGNGSVMADSNPILFYKKAGTYNLKIVVYSADQCKDSLTKPVNVYPNPVSDFELLYNQNTAPYVELHNNSKGADTYYWRWGKNFESYMMHERVHFQDIVNNPVSLLVQTQYGCSDSVSHQFSEYFHELFVPNAFSPNISPNDSFSKFQAKGIGLKYYKLRIFSSSGELLYELEKYFEDHEDGVPEYKDGWDGTVDINGNKIDCPPDVYVWRINAIFKDDTVWPGRKYKGQSYPYGYVMLIR